MCSACGEHKPYINAETGQPNFHSSKRSQDGWGTQCRSCGNERWRRYYVTHREATLVRMKKWRDANPDKVSAQRRRYRDRVKLRE